MTTIINKYTGITHPVIGEGLEEKEIELIYNAWKISNCSRGIHLFDEVWSDCDHYLVCDACNIEVHINKIIIPDDKNHIIDNSNAKKIKKK